MKVKVAGEDGTIRSSQGVGLKTPAGAGAILTRGEDVPLERGDNETLM